MRHTGARAEVLAVGDELLGPVRVDSNSLFIARQLSGLGIPVWRKSVIGDDLEAITEAISEAVGRSQVLIVTGGLGPTSDDLTRESAAQALKRPLATDPALIRGLEERYQVINRPLLDNSRRQAQVLEGARVLANQRGTAPGQLIEVGQVLTFLLPGPPRELEPMFMELVLPAIAEKFQTRPWPIRHFRVASEVESDLDSRIEPIYSTYTNIDTTILSSPGIIDLFFSATGTGPVDELVAELDQLAGEVKDLLGYSVFAERDDSLEVVVGRLLSAQGSTLATAESCTGGMVGERITQAPGSSAFYLGGVVAYSNALKEGLLAVSSQTLERYGAVSEAVAKEMVVGVCSKTGADCGVSITGVAGPEGGTAEKPVGTVCLGLLCDGEAATRQLQLFGNRDVIRQRSAVLAIDWLRRSLL